ncbi:MAG: hypothetical protein RL757_1727 [Bacteroidota bacterium]
MLEPTHQHIENHFSSSESLRDVVIGMSDGLTVPFALAAGLSGAVDSSKIILTAGIAEIIAGAIAMGLGGYLAGKTEIDHYQAELAREYDEVKRVPQVEKAECREILEEMGINPILSAQVVEELAKDEDKWVAFMMRFELGLEAPNPQRAFKSAANIGGSYILGGLIPLAPYAFCEKVPDALQFSAILTMFALLVFGFFKSRVIGQNPLKGAVQTMLIGAIAAAAAYFVAQRFS